MSVFSNTMTAGLPRSLSDKLTVVNAQECPFLAMVRKGPSVTQIKDEWPMDKYLAAEDSAIPDGKDVADFGNPNPDYAVAANRIQWVRPTAVKIGKLAQNVARQAGIKNQRAHAIKKKLDQVWRSCESILCSDNDVQAGTSQIGDKLRGVGAWLATSITTSGYDVPAAFLPAAGQISTTATASLTETGTTSAAINYLLYQTYLATGNGSTSYTGLVGGLLKQQFTSFTRWASGSNAYGSVRTYQTTDLTSLTWDVQVFVGDFGELKLIPTTYNAKYPTDYSTRRGHFLDMKLWEVVWMQQPQVVPLTNDGGGEKFAVDAIVGLRAFFPGGNFAIKSTS